MMVKKQYFLLGLVTITFLLLFPETTFGGIIPPGGGCKTQPTIGYFTECGEYKSVGSCGKECCKWECCEWAPEEYGGGCEGDCCVQECWACSCEVGKWWPEYKCDSPDCDGDILVRYCHVYHDCGPCAMGSCVDECCCVSCTAPEICEDCGSWQKPEREPCACPNWGLQKPECRCKSECIDKPESPRYYQNLLYPLDECSAEEGWLKMESDNVYLPVKLDWGDVRGWKDQWQEGGCKYVKDCQSGDKRCIEGDAIGQCKISCRDSCLEKLKDYKKLNLEGWLIPYQFPALYKKCLFKCESDCQNKYKTGAKGCSEICPYPDKCYPASGYVQSYVIKIEGEMRNCEALKRINELKKLIEEEPEKARIYEKEIKEIRKGTHPVYKLAMDNYAEALDKSEFIAPCSCMFKSNRDYQWKVRACCPLIKKIMTNEEFEKLYGDLCPGAQKDKKEELKQNGIWVESDLDEVCGPWSDTWKFTTNPAPEPKLPYDPDWAGLEGIENLSIGEFDKLEWCEINDPKRYPRIIIMSEEWYSPRSDKILIYYLDPGTNQYKCHLNLEGETGCYPMLLTPDMESREAFLAQIHPFEFVDKDKAYFTKLSSYAWKVSACEGFAGLNPTDYSQEWRFSTEDFTLPRPKVDFPPDNTEIPVGLPVKLKWSSPYAFSWNYVVEGVKSGKIFTNNISLGFDELSLDTVYGWKVQPCWDCEAEECENIWGGPWQFKTTGQPPELIYPENNAAEEMIPATFKWKEVGGAKSYVLRINGEEKIVEDGTEITLDYPDLLQETSYSWQVKTCAKDNGERCGDWSAPYNLTTLKLEAPVNPDPKDGSTISTTGSHFFSWSKVSGAKYYQFQIEYSGVSDREERKECMEKEGDTATKIVSENSVYHPLTCNGEYQWQVRGCLAENCEPESAGDWSETWSFILKSKEVAQEVSEEMLNEVLTNEVYPQVFQNIPEEVAKRTAEIISASTSEIVNQYFPGEISTTTINKLSIYASSSEILANLKPKFKESWQEQAVSALEEANSVTEVPEEVLDDVLNEKKGRISDKIYHEASGKITETTEKSEALGIIKNVIDENLKGVTQQISREVANRVSQKVLEITKETPQNLLEGMLAQISEEILKISKLEEVPTILEKIFNEEWKEELGRVTAKASTIPEIPEAVLTGVLAAMQGKIFENTLALVAKEIPGIPAKVEIRKGGLVPCGRTSDNPDTPWDETEKCGIKHLFIMLKVVIDFLLFRLAPLALVLLAVASGVIFYFSIKMESPTPLAKVKSLWKAAAIGFGILLFSWFLISFIFTLFGYQFGPWWRF